MKGKGERRGKTWSRGVEFVLEAKADYVTAVASLEMLYTIVIFHFSDLPTSNGPTGRMRNSGKGYKNHTYD